MFFDHKADHMMMCHAAAVTVRGNTKDEFGNTMPVRS